VSGREGLAVDTVADLSRRTVPLVQSDDPTGLAAVLWDMDGLLVDSEPLWTVAEQELADRLGGTFTPELKALIVGTRLDVAVPLFLTHLGHPASPEAVQEAAAWLLARVVELFAQPIDLQPGAVALLAELDAAGVPQALVSSSYRVLVDAVLAHGVGPFALTVAGDEVGRGKPHPEPYLTAAARLGVDPRRCVVLEDSPAGVASGEAAGCAVVAVPSLAEVVLSEAPRRQVRPSLTAVSLDDLRALAARSLSGGLGD
jgi:HAD superfamily hydrolase (TIGR01509 family)